MKETLKLCDRKRRFWCGGRAPNFIHPKLRNVFRSILFSNCKWWKLRNISTNLNQIWNLIELESPWFNYSHRVIGKSNKSMIFSPSTAVNGLAYALNNSQRQYLTIILTLLHEKRRKIGTAPNGHYPTPLLTLHLLAPSLLNCNCLHRGLRTCQCYKHTNKSHSVTSRLKYNLRGCVVKFHYLCFTVVKEVTHHLF